MKPRLRIGVSACLLGDAVRYDGNSKRNRMVCSALGNHIELIPVCPEVAIGMGVPRAPIQLVEIDSDIHALGRDDPSQEFTGPLTRYAREKTRTLHEISGFIFKSRSPSCGLGSTPIYRHHKKARKGSGLFTQELLGTNPMLPVTEESGIEDSHQRRQFLEQVYAYQDWQSMLGARITRATLLKFHQRYRLQLMAHGFMHLRRLEQLLQADIALKPLIGQYGAGFMSCLRYRTTTAKQFQLLKHLCRPLRPLVSPAQWDKLQTLLQDYRQQNITLHRAASTIAREYRRRGLHNPAAEHYFSLT